MMKYKCRVNNGVWFIPKVEFISEWAAWLYIKSVFGDAAINDCRMVPLTPGMLSEQA